MANCILKTNDEFTPRFLYVKKCGHCELRYFGMTTTKDITKYQGSGTLWKAHLKKYRCRKQVETIFFELFTDKEDCVEFATFLSEFADIVKSPCWANLIIEDGLNNGLSSPNITAATKRKMSDSHTGSKHSLERRRNISKSLTGKPKSPEHRQKNSESQKSRKNSPDRGKRISEANKGRETTLEWRQNLSKSLKGKSKSKIMCPHCDKIGASGIMKRWHFDKCKLLR